MTRKPTSDLITRFRKFILNKWTVDKSGKSPGETHRWFFCHDQFGGKMFDLSGDFDDCGCCMIAPEVWPEGCECNCHHRLEQIEEFITQAYNEGRYDAIADYVE